MMKTSQNGRAIIEQFEGRRAKLYDDTTGKTIARARDAKGNPSIGVGHLISKNDTRYDGVTLTDAEIDALLDTDLAESERRINTIRDKVALNQNQFDALVSFVFNVGPGKKGVKDGLFELKRGGPSTLYRKVIGADYSGAANEFGKWIHAGGVALDGLRARRTVEASLFRRPV